MRTESAQNRFSFSGSDLKIIACISMFADHCARILNFSGAAQLIFCHLIGRIAFPVFAFLLVEGFLHTRSRLRYFITLLLFALLSEIPYDLALSETAGLLPTPAVQNTLFTLGLGLLMLCCIKKTETLPFGSVPVFGNISAAALTAVLFFGAAAQLLHLDYGFFGIACIGAMYLFRIRPSEAAFWGCVCLNLDFLSMPGAFLSLLPLSRYNGSRGKQLKAAFYLFYPLHLLFLLAVKQVLL